MAMKDILIEESDEGNASHNAENKRPSARSQVDEKASIDLRSAVDRRVFDILRQPVVVLDGDHRILSANSAFYRLIEATPEAANDRALTDIGTRILNAPGLSEFLNRVQSNPSTERHHQFDIRPNTSELRRLVVSAQRLVEMPPGGKLLVAIDDTADRQAVDRTQLGDETQPGQKRQGALSTIAMVNHELRQPLQTLSLLQGLLAVKAKDPELHELIARIDDSLGALAGTLNAAAYASQLDDNLVEPELAAIPMDVVLNRLRPTLRYHAEAKGLNWRIVPSRMVVRTDPRLIEQLFRALLLNAIKMIKHGIVLLGCKRRKGRLGIQIWVNGTCIPEQQQQAILDEFHRPNRTLADTAPVHSLIRPIAKILGVSLKARSRPGPGLVFAAEMPLVSDVPMHPSPDVAAFTAEGPNSKATIAVLSDDPAARDMLILLLKEIGYETMTISNDDEALTLQQPSAKRPGVIVLDFDPSSAPGSLQATRKLLGSEIPAIVLADEASRQLSKTIAAEPNVYLCKPVTAGDLAQQIDQLMSARRVRYPLVAASEAVTRQSPPQTVFVVDDDDAICDAMRGALGARGLNVELYSSGEAFIDSISPTRRGCLVIDNAMPEMSGVEVLERLASEGSAIPSIMITGHGDISTAVRAMKAGAIEFIEKPIPYKQLLSAIDRAFLIDQSSAERLLWRQSAEARIATLTPRERQVMDLVVDGLSNKAIAKVLAISQRTVENHRAAAMKRVGVSSLPDLIRFTMRLRTSDRDPSPAA
jgi:two-component system CheB/CheR fusion protein